MFAKTICIPNIPTSQKLRQATSCRAARLLGVLPKPWTDRTCAPWPRWPPGFSIRPPPARAVHAVATRFVDRARRGDGPSFLVCNTYRYSGHHVGDINREYYRTKQEEQFWKTERDPIKLHAQWLLAQDYADAVGLDRISAEARAEMEAAVQFAIAAP